MRITNSMMVNQYNRNLQSSLSSFNSASLQVTTGRAFETASESPSSAVKAYQLRREYTNNEIYLTNARNLEGVYTAQEDGLMEIHEICETISSDLLQGVTGTMSDEDRSIIAEKLDTLKENMLSTLNAEYAGNNVFAGSYTKEVPFSLNDDGELMFRGISVNTEDPVELAKLEEYSKEEILVDVGFGLSSDATGTTDPSSAVDSALPILSIIGFGHTIDADGKSAPNNLFTQISDLATELRDDDLDLSKIIRLEDAFDATRDNVLLTVTSMGSRNTFLENMTSRLENNKITLTEKIVNVEKVDPEEAIMNMKMYEYSYTAALSIGNKILQPSFIDFMS